MINTDGWSAMKKLKHSLLRRAFDQNRGGEVILLIQWRAAAVRHAAERDVEILKKFEERNAGQPRAIRALNLIEEQNGSNTIHKLTEDKTSPRSTFQQVVHDVPEEKRILFIDKEREAKIAAYANVQPLNADHYDPMEGLRITTGYDLACRACAALEAAPKPAPRMPQ